MKKILKIASFTGLALTAFPSFFVFNGLIDIKLNFTLMIIGMVLWFATAPFWMKSKSLDEVEE